MRLRELDTPLQRYAEAQCSSYASEEAHYSAGWSSENGMHYVKVTDSHAGEFIG
jgi:hypothetical protein